MKHASLENSRVGKFWEYDCLMICTLLGLSLSNREIRDLCTKYKILPEEDAEDPALGFYALHHACHVEEGPIPRFLSRNFSLKYRNFRQALERHHEDSPLNLGEFLGKPHPKPLGGGLWAVLNDPRKAIQAQGIYGAHKIVLNALREYQKSLGEKEESAVNTEKEASAEEARLSCISGEMEKLRRQCEDLQKEIGLREARHQAREKSFREEKQKLRDAYEEKISKLRRRIRLLEYSPGHEVEASSEKQDGPLKKLRENPLFSCPKRENPELHAPGEDAPSACPSQGCPFCMLSDTTISVIGGLSRLEQQYREVVERLGARCRYHCGNCQQGGKNLKQIIQSSDRVVFITSINSHNALRVTKGICKKEGKPLHLLRETSPAALEKIFASRAAGESEAPAV